MGRINIKKLDNILNIKYINYIGYLNPLNFLNNAVEFNQEEKEIIETVKKIVNDTNTKVLFDLDSMDCILHNEVLHYSCIIDSCSILISNSVFSLRNRWRVEVLNECKGFGEKRIKTETDNIRKIIYQSEEQILSKINAELN